ncbi:MAG: hypothetical protein JW940_00035 [Polyangiaceae bacterium]|nr:hypothetical protein [Polyangiaceae bacterium]
MLVETSAFGAGRSQGADVERADRLHSPSGLVPLDFGREGRAERQCPPPDEAVAVSLLGGLHPEPDTGHSLLHETRCGPGLTGESSQLSALRGFERLGKRPADDQEIVLAERRQALERFPVGT